MGNRKGKQRVQGGMCRAARMARWGGRGRFNGNELLMCKERWEQQETLVRC